MNQRPLSEKQITQQIMSVLKIHGIVRWKQWQGPMSTPGIPDILAVQPKTGRLIAVEVKTERGRVSPIQERVMQILRDAGALVIVARSVDDLMGRIDELKGKG